MFTEGEESLGSSWERGRDFSEKLLDHFVSLYGLSVPSHGGAGVVLSKLMYCNESVKSPRVAIR